MSFNLICFCICGECFSHWIQNQPIRQSRKFKVKMADGVGNGVWLMQKRYYCWGNYVYVHRTVESEMSNGKLDDSVGLLLICS